ncbi:1-acyl-sn-glycerol-3-phosphate acyltransferase [Reichenbachiella carrageenanivorans]|uniref:1-acyl-sn-glycerol-3-phosphate acyltransferase n=1 Tax=Reichenbachiella carrageenanivorans TaxID=2979869 RepID=A0ABY6CZ29_9BACT|nr:1-acyl-sn-glycerol-3-phosphate acyltransferase [Reichenbachiella carrageenanivorans]UXX78048.1 1-acyl-sn-glycerol-3-phosphate acyltransferase [Reichenbachiella carrageenanivorans]
MIRFLAKFIFITLLGWKIKGSISDKTKKCVIAIAPHTSYWDFFIGIVVRPINNLRSSFLVKKEVFKFAPMGWVVKRMGGIAVDRGKNNSSLIDQVIRIFKEREVMRLAITPEGTRSKVTEWKTGFYRIAVAANVPIILVSFDFAKKEVEFKEEFHPTGDMTADIDYIKSQFVGVQGKHPELG